MEIRAMNRDFAEMLNALSVEGVEFLVTQADIVYQIGVPPNRIDLLTTIDGVEVEDAWRERIACVVE